VQAGYGDNVLMWGQSDVVYGSLSKKKGRKQVCVTKQGWGGQWLQQAGLIKNSKKWVVLKMEGILWKSDYEQM
jgi:hypothetical protein